MTASERNRGWVFFALYILVFPRLMGWFQRLISGDAEPLIAESNLIYYALLFALTLLVFWSFLRHAFSLLLDWLPENLFAIVTGLAGAGVLHFLVMLLPYPVENPAAADWSSEFLLSPAPTLVVVLVLMPLVEEVLFRGLVFGSLRRYSRPLAYVVTVLGYAVACVWQYMLAHGLRRALPAPLPPVPAHVPGPHLVLRQRRLHLERRAPPCHPQRRPAAAGPAVRKRLTPERRSYAPYSAA